MADSRSGARRACAVLLSKDFVSSRKGQLLLGEVASSFISFVCFCASTAAVFVTAPLLAFLTALFLLFAYSTKFNERFKGFQWPLMVFGFIATIVFALDFYFIFNELADFIKGGGTNEEPQNAEDGDLDTDSD
ncbi:CKLF-like MARVEL transmembrane domain-containing protein 3 isoform X2 [Electrophorus electricus]|uniref:CKLF-like MARVEL transmembrane domain-containing protein 3 isoform X2 n=1 Tax=Electrophorus electricus TaxID=8005 RepID=UPI000F0A67F2|nr:CKLF-like MARVEL transmembrane domain-containing protein 3 isoform X2 [Electrophorus electricus]